MAGRLLHETRALGRETAPAEGTSIQPFHRPSSNDITPPSVVGVLPKNVLAFVTSNAAAHMQEADGHNDVVLLKGTLRGTLRGCERECIYVELRG